MHALIAVQVAFCFVVHFVAGTVWSRHSTGCQISPPAFPRNGF